MAKRRFNKTQIQNILQKYKDGMSIKEIIEQYGISQATFYNWRAKYINESNTTLREINKLREDNERLKRMFADLSLENLTLKAQLKKHIDT